MNRNLLTGKMVRLEGVDSQVMADSLVKFSRDTEYWRLLAGEAARAHSVKSTKEWLDKELEKDPPAFWMFSIYSLEDQRLIGEIGLDDIQWNQGDTFVGISIGDRELWGKGYGTDAMRVILRYVFTELNLYRVSLTVFEYNQRAVRSYEKVGFMHEGRMRQAMQRAGKRWDLLFMGITRDEWLAKYSQDWLAELD